MVSQTTSSKFWTWLNHNAARLHTLACGDDTEQHQMAKEITAQLRLFTSLNWEIGKTKTQGRLLFSFAPHDADSLLEAEKYTAEARTHRSARWQVTSARPPKPSLPRVIISYDGSQREYSTDSWTYNLTAYNSFSFFDVAVQGDNLEEDNRECDAAATLATRLILGDVLYVRYIGRVSVGTRKNNDSTAFALLREHIVDLCT